MTPAHGCCPKGAPPPEPCILCQYGTTPQNIQVTIAGVTAQPGGCVDCIALNDDFVVVGDIFTNACYWQYLLPSALCWIDEIYLVAYRPTAGVTRIKVVLFAHPEGTIWEPDALDAAVYQLDVEAELIDCGFAGLALPLVFVEDQDQSKVLCGLGASTCTVTSL